MKAAIIAFSIALVALGMWMMSNTLFEKDEAVADNKPASQSVHAADQPEASTAVLGLALLVGGVLLLVVAARREA